jgi:hypothetical protein
MAGKPQKLKKRSATERQRDAEAESQLVDLELEHSFPASDPPSWTPVVRDGAPKKD